MKKILTVMAIIVAVMLIAFTLTDKKNEPAVPVTVTTNTSSNEIVLRIMTTNYLTYEMAKDISDDKHDVEYMFNDPKSQWEFNFTKDSVNNIGKKDLFIYAGAGFEPWIDKFIDGVAKGKVSIINASRGIKTIPYNQEIMYNDTAMKENPFYWMAIDNYETALSNVATAIEDKDPKNRNFYNNNFYKCINKLKNYKTEYSKETSKLSDVVFVTTNDSLDYFFKDYNLKTIKLYSDGNSHSDAESQIQQSISDSKTVVFVYNDDIEDIQSNKDLIDKYNLQKINLLCFQDNCRYTDILEHNINSLKSITLNDSSDEE